MPATIADVRLILNIPDEGDLADAVIGVALERAEGRVDALERVGVSAGVRLDAVRSMASHLAYQTYSDRVVHKLEGSYDSEGRWDPVATVRIRETRDKLESLRKDANRAIQLVKIRSGRLI